MAEHLPQLQLNSTATKKLTRPYLAKLNRQNYIATAVTILIVIFGLFSGSLDKLGGQEKTIYFADSTYGVAAWIGSFWAFQTAYRARFGPLRLEPRHQLAWFVIGIALLANGIGGFYYTYLEWTGQLNPVPVRCRSLLYNLLFPHLHRSTPHAHSREIQTVSYSHWVGCHYYHALQFGNKPYFL